MTDRDRPPMTIDVRAHVRRAVADAWPGFAERHPRLAAVLDEELLVEQACGCVADDPEYRDAMDRAAAAGMAVEAVADVIRKCVRQWIGRLV